jgi:hypothetical protein
LVKYKLKKIIKFVKNNTTMDKKMDLGTALIGLAITLGTIYVVAYVAGKGWEKGTK